MNNNRHIAQYNHDNGSSDEDFDDFGDTDECLVTKKVEQELETTKRAVTPTIDRNNLKVDQKFRHQQIQHEKSQSEQTCNNRQQNYKIDIEQYAMIKSDSKASLNTLNNQTYHQSQNTTIKTSLNNVAKSKERQRPSTQGSNLQTLYNDAKSNKLFETQSSTNGQQNFNSNQQFQQYATAPSDNYFTQTGQNIENDDPEYEKDFNKAYLKMVEKVYSTQGTNILISQEELNKIAYQQQLSVQDFQQRNVQCLENKVQKTKILEEALKEKEMQECTFKPQTYSQKPKRNLDQFLKDQQQFEEQRLKKQKERQERENLIKQSELKYQPQVNKKSAKMVDSKKDQKENVVFQRLYNINQERMQKQAQKMMQETQDSRTSSRNLKKVKSESNFLSARSRERESGKTVDQMLYDDAKRRWEHQEQKKKQLSKLKEEQIQSTKPPTGHNNVKYVASKFEKDFFSILANVLDEEDCISLEKCEDQVKYILQKRLNYMKLGKLMTDMGYIPSNNIQADSVERELLFDMWNLLNGEDTNGITVLNIKKFLLALQGITLDNIHHHDIKQSQRGSDMQKAQSSLISTMLIECFDENGTLKLSQTDVNKIFVKFKPFYINRIQYVGQIKRHSTFVDNTCTFKPQLNKNTEQLASQKRQKLLSEVNQSDNNMDGQKVDIVQILLHPQYLDQNWKSHAKEVLEQKELQECTFKPKISSYESNLSKSKSQSRLAGFDKCIELYSRARPQNDKRDKTQHDFEYEKGKDECTFQPNIETSQKNFDVLYASSTSRFGSSNFHSDGMSDISQITQGIKGYEGAMNRMKKGREQKEKEKMMFTRGIPGTTTDESLLQPMQISGNQSYKGTFSNYSYNVNGDVSTISNATKLSHSKSNEFLGMTNQSNRRESGYKMKRESGQGTVQEALKENKNLQNQEKQLKSFFKQNNQESDNKKNSKTPRYSDECKPNNSQPHIDYNYDFNNGEKLKEENESPLPMSNKQQNHKQPLLYVDVNLGPGKSERIVVYDGDTAESLAEQFSKKHNLDNNMKSKLTMLLDSQIAGLLEKIEEEQNSIHSDNLCE